MNKINNELLFLISSNLIIKDIIKLFSLNRTLNLVLKSDYKLFCSNYFPMYNSIKNYNDFKDLLKINFNNVFYINKDKLINFIRKNYWAYNFFKHKYININNKNDYYIHNMIINIMKNIYLVRQLDQKEDNDKYLNKDKDKQFLYDIGIGYYKMKEELLLETEMFKKDLDYYLEYNIKKKIRFNNNLNYLVVNMI